MNKKKKSKKIKWKEYGGDGYSEVECEKVQIGDYVLTVYHSGYWDLSDTGNMSLKYGTSPTHTMVGAKLNVLNELLIKLSRMKRQTMRLMAKIQ